MTGTAFFRRSLAALAAVALLAACDPSVPDSGPGGGVGFNDYGAYLERRAARDRALERPQTVRPPEQPLAAPMASATPVYPAPAPAQAPLSGTVPPPSEPQAIAAEAMAAIGASAQPQPAPAQAPASVATPAPAPAPEFSGNNVVAFALATSHPVGQQMYRRTNPLRDRLSLRACAKYPSGGLAQEAFLSRGGPERDPLHLDPDGDGYACGWDPTPFRKLGN